MVSFDVLPLAAIINGRFLCLHGGLSPEMAGRQDVDKVSRFMEPPQYGMFCDILWSDPTPNDTGLLDGTTDPFSFNGIRGCSFFFGQDACTRYLRKNNFLTLIRAHEAQLDGYKCHHWGNEGFPQVITIFSAPNYCGVYKNVAGFINFENSDMNIQQFFPTEYAQPYTLPSNLDVWSWSIPFVSEKSSLPSHLVTEIFLEVIKETRNAVDDTLTYEEQIQFDEIMRIPQVQRLVLVEPTVNAEGRTQPDLRGFDQPT
jgi:serine/threonine-protein phosphatase 2B catalytic subunit